MANILRLLEDWNGDYLNFNGSMAVLYHSETASSPWWYGWSGYYLAPTQRNFGFTNYFSGGLQTNVPALKMALRQSYRGLTPL